MVLTVNVICEEHNITKGYLEIGCDNVEALSKAVDIDYFMKSLEHPLQITTFLYGKCLAIQQPVLEGGLPALGICSNTH